MSIIILVLNPYCYQVKYKKNMRRAHDIIFVSYNFNQMNTRPRIPVLLNALVLEYYLRSTPTRNLVL